MALDELGQRFNIEQPEIFLESLTRVILEGIKEPLQLRGVLKLGDGFLDISTELLEFASNFLPITNDLIGTPLETINTPIKNIIKGYVALRVYEAPSKKIIDSVRQKYLVHSLNYFLELMNDLTAFYQSVIGVGFSDPSRNKSDNRPMGQLECLQFLINFPQIFRRIISLLRKAFILKTRISSTGQEAIKQYVQLLESQFFKQNNLLSDILAACLALELIDIYRQYEVGKETLVKYSGNLVEKTLNVLPIMARAYTWLSEIEMTSELEIFLDERTSRNFFHFYREIPILFFHKNNQYSKENYFQIFSILEQERVFQELIRIISLILKNYKNRDSSWRKIFPKESLKELYLFKGKAHFALAETCEQVSKYELANENYSKASLCYKESGEKTMSKEANMRQVETILELAREADDMNDFLTAATKYAEAVKILQKVGEKKLAKKYEEERLQKVYQLISDTFNLAIELQEAGNLEEADSKFAEVEDWYKRLKNPAELGKVRQLRIHALEELADKSIEKRAIREAIAYLNKSLSVIRSLKDQKQLVKTYRKYADLLEALSPEDAAHFYDEAGKLYVELEMFDKAKEVLEKKVLITVLGRLSNKSIQD
ncbi:MAG: hypothetical protein GF308_07125 [Candidatus Heimdallarchaeota archaeon]|nr:hypothetical protein [Candidatus Heimdallarchaeota archaeon]